jgi:hypothetical protein
MDLEQSSIIYASDSVLGVQHCLKPDIFKHPNLEIFCGPHLDLDVDIPLQELSDPSYKSTTGVFFGPYCTLGV